MEVDREANKKAIRVVSTSRQHWLARQVSSMCGVGKLMKIWGETETDVCPRCGEPETSSHVLACWDPEAIQTFNASLEKLGEWMVKAKMDKAIGEVVKVARQQWK